MIVVGFAIYVLVGVAASLLLFPYSAVYLILHCGIGAASIATVYRGSVSDRSAARFVWLFAAAGAAFTAIFLLAWRNASAEFQAQIVELLVAPSLLIDPAEYLERIASRINDNGPDYIGFAAWLTLSPFLLMAFFSSKTLAAAASVRTAWVKPTKVKKAIYGSLGSLFFLGATALIIWMNLDHVVQMHHLVLAWPYIYERDFYSFLVFNGALGAMTAIAGTLVTAMAAVWLCECRKG